MGADYNYFYYSSPTQEVRDNYEDELVELYHKSMEEILIKLKYRSKVPTLNDVKRNIKNYDLFGE